MLFKAASLSLVCAMCTNESTAFLAPTTLSHTRSASNSQHSQHSQSSQHSQHSQPSHRSMSPQPFDDGSFDELAEIRERMALKEMMSRRGAIARASSAAAVVGYAGYAAAANAASSGFSDGFSASSSASKGELVVKNESSEPVAPAAPAAPASTSSTSSTSSKFEPKIVSPFSNRPMYVPPPSTSTTKSQDALSELEVDATAAVALVGLGGFAAYTTQVYTEDPSPDGDGGVPAAKAPGPLPYGLAAGRNFEADGKAVEKEPPKPAPVSPPPAATDSKKEESAQSARASKWFNAPTPYGIQNKDKNPFIKQVEEFCEPKKVSPECTDSIKEYIGSLTGPDSVTKEDATTVINYLDSIGASGASGGSSIGGGSKAGAAMFNYLDAISSGNTPAPSSAQMVKGYLDTLTNGSFSGVVPTQAKKAPKVSTTVSTTVSTNKSPVAVTGEAVEKVANVATSDPYADQYADQFATFETRITSVEQRVTKLEDRIDQIPDQVMARMEGKMNEWQERQERTLSSKVEEIVNAMEDRFGGAGGVAGAVGAAGSEEEVVSDVSEEVVVESVESDIGSAGAAFGKEIGLDTTAPKKVGGFGSYLDSLSP